MCPKLGFWGVLRVKMWKDCVLTPKRHYSAWICVCWCRLSHVQIGSTAWALGPWKDLAYKEEIKKMSGNFGYMGRSNPWGDFDQMRLVGRYGGCNHVCNISWLSVKGCGCGVRGNLAFSHWLDASPLQHWIVVEYRSLIMTCNVKH